ncbi:sugar ABC transporter ATP-binding protein [Aureimonas endophytica]|uniref:Sugar ABC transporter ATP-binding protein n=1 Tax=Aureimonas endophytica TaxID=2027858 RepID=A0A916ZUW9_9HYPH|nr:sn-glycerol-3-phosphate ABC transporter ATP-binding protein UgpC [Aureimonas endophytica]GGE15313.1 sugar ABC transporter ATP-binding protein [Aureimonas endophytica]
MAGLTLRGLRKNYGAVEVIKGIDLDVADRDFVVFVGPSGCGKSTLLRMIAGLEKITAGDLVIDGQRANEVDPSDRGLAMVFQSYALYPHMTVAENMGFALKIGGMAAAERAAKVKAAADVLQLAHLLDRRPKELSGGQRQRVAIGRAIVRNPKVFLFDEPLSNLDAALRVNMRLELMRLHQQLKATMIYVTHDQTEAMTMANKIVVLNGGHIEQVGSPMELYRNPANSFVATFIGSPKMNMLDLPVEAADRQGLRFALGNGRGLTVPVDGSGLRPGETARLGIRPEHLKPAAAGPFTGEAAIIEHLGGLTILHVDLGRAGMLVVQAEGDDRTGLGARLVLDVDPALCHVFDATGRALRRVAVREAA